MALLYNGIDFKPIDSKKMPSWLEDLNCEHGIGEINGKQVMFVWPKWWVPGRGLKASAINETLDKYCG